MESKNTSGVELVTVQFHEDRLQAVKVSETDVLAVLARLCEPLGLDPNAQRQRLTDLARCPWAEGRACVLHARDATDRQNSVFCVHLDIIPMWLATISVGHVRPELRPKVIRYQKECARVLRDHFFPAANSSQVPPGFAEFAQQMLLMMRQFGELVVQTIAKQQSVPVPAFSPIGEMVTIRGRCEELGFQFRDSHRNQIRDRLIPKLLLAGECPMKIGNVWHLHAKSVTILDREIRKQDDLIRKREKDAGPDLFNRFKDAARN